MYQQKPCSAAPLSSATALRITIELILVSIVAILPLARLAASEPSIAADSQPVKSAPTAAETLLKGILSHGHTAIYEIHFETNEASLRMEASRLALDEIAKLLKSNPGLKLLVVAHTDSAGTIGHNLDLSRRRAVVIVNTLASNYGIDKGRLLPAGVGFLAPIASNRAEEGQALNRRVELVEWVEQR